MFVNTTTPPRNHVRFSEKSIAQKSLPPLPPSYEIKSPLHQLERQISIARSNSTRSLSANRPTRSNSAPVRTLAERHKFKKANVPRSTSAQHSLAPPRLEHPPFKSIKMPSSHSPSRDDLESLYSFDSMTTNGRLLDRLDINKNDIYDGEGFDLSKRDSIASVQTTGRLLDRLGLDDDGSDISDDHIEPAHYNPRNRPVLNPIANLERKPAGKLGLASIGGLGRKPERAATKINIKKIRQNIVHENANPSTDSIAADFGSIDRMDNESIASSLKRSTTVASSNGSQDTSRVSTESFHQPDYHGSIFNNSEGELASTAINISRTPSAPIIRSGNVGQRSSPSSSRRAVSEGTGNSSNSNLSSENSTDFTPEARINLASQLRTMGKHREASYQLQIAANSPYNSTKAMYLYAMSLRIGQGVKQNDRHCLKWLCKCILVDFHSKSQHQPVSSPQVSKLTDKLSQLQPEDLVKLILKQLDHTAKSDPLQHGNNPMLVYERFVGLSKAQINKVATISKNKLDVVAVSYHELGKALINGWGHPKDEINGIRLLSMAGSMGNVHSMIELGEIWTSKSKYHKKDHFKAAAWLRSSELFGFKSIGNSWIYKEKYLR